MDLRQLRYFVAIAETHSLSKAGERLNIAQPALSLQLAALEGELSTRLFDRGSRGVTLTANGARLLAHATRILQSVNTAISELKTQDTSLGGRVSVGMPGTIAGVLSLTLIRQVRDKFPNVRLTIGETSGINLMRQLEHGEVDVAVVVNELEGVALEVTPVALENFYLVGPPDQSDGTTTIDWATLSQLPLLLTSAGNMSRKLYDHAARASGIKLEPVAEIDAVHLLKDAARAGLGYAILPGSACMACETSSYWARRILKPELQAVISVAMSNVRSGNRSQQAVRETIVEICRGLVDRGIWLDLPAR